jgi:hypothetical protein
MTKTNDAIPFEGLSAEAQTAAFLLVSMVYFVSHSEIYDRGESMGWVSVDGQPATRNYLKCGIRGLDEAGWLAHHYAQIQLKHDRFFEIVPYAEGQEFLDAAIAYCRMRTERSSGRLHYYGSFPSDDRGCLFHLLYLKQDTEGLLEFLRRNGDATPPLRMDWLQTPYVNALPDAYVATILLDDLSLAVKHLPELTVVKPWLESFTKEVYPRSYYKARIILAEWNFLMGDATPMVGVEGESNWSLTCFLKGDFERARTLYTEEILIHTGTPRKRAYCLPGLAGPLSIMACLASDDPQDWELARLRASAGSKPQRC